MKRKTSMAPTRIWSFGAGEPTSGLELCRDQLGGALWYWNALVRIQLARKRAIEVAEAELPEASVAAWKTLKKQAMAEIKVAPQNVKDIQERLRDALDALPGYDRIRAINDVATVHTKDARAAARLHFGSYVLVEKSVQEAMAPKTGIKWSPPRQKYFADHSALMRGGQAMMAEGRLGAHIMKGASVSELFTNTMLQIEWPELEMSNGKWEATRSERRRACRVIARIRAGSDAHRKPLWVEFPVVIHRPLPSDARIKAGWLACRYVGTRWKYMLQLQVESATFAADKPAGSGTVAVDLCWRKRDEGIRVAYLCDEAGVRREMIMPTDVIDDFNTADKIKGYADESFNAGRNQMADAIGGLVLSEMHQYHFASLRLWRSAQRWAAAVTWWHDHRFVGDAQAFATAWASVQRWRHLYQYSEGIRSKALARRKDYYEDFALQLCKQYAKVVLGDFDMRDTVELAKGAKDAPKGARHNRVMASPSEFRLALKSTAARLGADVDIVDCAKATLTCAVCDHEHVLDPFDVDFRCVNCSTVWDRGHNHCLNLLRRAGGSVLPPHRQALAPMIPTVCAKPRGQVKQRDRAVRRRSKSARQCAIIV